MGGSESHSLSSETKEGDDIAKSNPQSYKQVPHALRTSKVSGCSKCRGNFHRDCRKCWALQMERYLTQQAPLIPELKFGSGVVWNTAEDPLTDISRFSACDSFLSISLLEISTSASVGTSRLPRVAVALHPPRNTTKALSVEAKAKLNEEEEKIPQSSSQPPTLFVPFETKPLPGTRIMHKPEGSEGSPMYGTVVAAPTTTQTSSLPIANVIPEVPMDLAPPSSRVLSSSINSPLSALIGRIMRKDSMKIQRKKNTKKKEKKKKAGTQTGTMQQPVEEKWKCYVKFDDSPKLDTFDFRKLSNCWNVSPNAINPTDDSLAGHGLPPLGLAAAERKSGGGKEAIIHNAKRPEVKVHRLEGQKIHAVWPTGSHMCSWGLQNGKNPTGSVIEVLITWKGLQTDAQNMKKKKRRHRNSVPFTARFELTLGSPHLPANSVTDRWYKFQPIHRTTGQDGQGLVIKPSGKFPDVYLRMRVKFSPPPPLHTCSVCYDEFLKTQLAFICPTDESHAQCLDCFRSYVRVCCSDYMLGKLPIGCAICKTLVPESAIHKLLTPEGWDNYVLTSISAGLNDRAFADSVPVTCQKCNKYHEFFPADFQETAKALFRELVHDQAHDLLLLLDRKKHRFWSAFAREQRRVLLARKQEEEIARTVAAKKKLIAKIGPALKEAESALESSSAVTCTRCGVAAPRPEMDVRVCHVGSPDYSRECKHCSRRPVYECCGTCCFHGGVGETGGNEGCVEHQIGEKDFKSGSFSLFPKELTDTEAEGKTVTATSQGGKSSLSAGKPPKDAKSIKKTLTAVSLRSTLMKSIIMGKKLKRTRLSAGYNEPGVYERLIISYRPSLVIEEAENTLNTIMNDSILLGGIGCYPSKEKSSKVEIEVYKTSHRACNKDGPKGELITRIEAIIPKADTGVVTVKFKEPVVLQAYVDYIVVFNQNKSPLKKGYTARKPIDLPKGVLDVREMSRGVASVHYGNDPSTNKQLRPFLLDQIDRVQPETQPADDSDKTKPKSDTKREVEDRAEEVGIRNLMVVTEGQDKDSKLGLIGCQQGDIVEVLSRWPDVDGDNDDLLYVHIISEISPDVLNFVSGNVNEDGDSEEGKSSKPLREGQRGWIQASSVVHVRDATRHKLLMTKLQNAASEYRSVAMATAVDLYMNSGATAEEKDGKKKEFQESQMQKENSRLKASFVSLLDAQQAQHNVQQQQQQSRGPPMQINQFLAWRNRTEVQNKLDLLQQVIAKSSADLKQKSRRKHNYIKSIKELQKSHELPSWASAQDFAAAEPEDKNDTSSESSEEEKIVSPVRSTFLSLSTRSIGVPPPPTNVPVPKKKRMYKKKVSFGSSYEGYGHREAKKARSKLETVRDYIFSEAKCKCCNSVGTVGSLTAERCHTGRRDPTLLCLLCGRMGACIRCGGCVVHGDCPLHDIEVVEEQRKAKWGKTGMKIEHTGGLVANYFNSTVSNNIHAGYKDPVEVVWRAGGVCLIRRIKTSTRIDFYDPDSDVDEITQKLQVSPFHPYDPTHLRQQNNGVFQKCGITGLFISPEDMCWVSQPKKRKKRAKKLFSKEPELESCGVAVARLSGREMLLTVNRPKKYKSKRRVKPSKHAPEGQDTVLILEEDLKKTQKMDFRNIWKKNKMMEIMESYPRYVLISQLKRRWSAAKFAYQLVGCEVCGAIDNLLSLSNGKCHSHSHSGSQVKGQTPAACSICEEKKGVHSCCLRCSNHSWMGSCSNHRLAPLREITATFSEGLDDDDKVRLGKIGSDNSKAPISASISVLAKAKKTKSNDSDGDSQMWKTCPRVIGITVWLPPGLHVISLTAPPFHLVRGRYQFDVQPAERKDGKDTKDGSGSSSDSGPGSASASTRRINFKSPVDLKELRRIKVMVERTTANPSSWIGLGKKNVSRLEWEGTKVTITKPCKNPMLICATHFALPPKQSTEITKTNDTTETSAATTDTTTTSKQSETKEVKDSSGLEDKHSETVKSTHKYAQLTEALPEVRDYHTGSALGIPLPSSSDPPSVQKTWPAGLFLKSPARFVRIVKLFVREGWALCVTVDSPEGELKPIAKKAKKTVFKKSIINADEPFDSFMPVLPSEPRTGFIEIERLSPVSDTLADKLNEVERTVELRMNTAILQMTAANLVRRRHLAVVSRIPQARLADLTPYGKLYKIVKFKDPLSEGSTGYLGRVETAKTFKSTTWYNTDARPNHLDFRVECIHSGEKALAATPVLISGAFVFLKTDKNQKKKKGGKSVDSLSSWKATLELFESSELRKSPKAKCIARAVVRSDALPPTTKGLIPILFEKPAQLKRGKWMTFRLIMDSGESAFGCNMPEYALAELKDSESAIKVPEIKSEGIPESNPYVELRFRTTQFDDGRPDGGTTQVSGQFPALILFTPGAQSLHPKSPLGALLTAGLTKFDSITSKLPRFLRATEDVSADVGNYGGSILFSPLVKGTVIRVENTISKRGFPSVVIGRAFSLGETKATREASKDFSRRMKIWRSAGLPDATGPASPTLCYIFKGLEPVKKTEADSFAKTWAEMEQKAILSSQNRRRRRISQIARRLSTSRSKSRSRADSKSPIGDDADPLSPRSSRGRRGSRVRSRSNSLVRGNAGDRALEWEWQCGVCLFVNPFDPAREVATEKNCQLCGTPGVFNAAETEGDGEGESVAPGTDMKDDLESEDIKSEDEEMVENQQVAQLGVADDELTGLYFECQTGTCKTITCLRCLKFVARNQVMKHDCDGVLQSFSLYKDIVSVLTKAASQSCSNCGNQGIKDLACTHISCQCGKTWCYACGQVSGNFSGHNQWQQKPSGKKKVGHCPMYLKDMYKTADVAAGINPARALVAFHTQKQLVALSKFVKDNCPPGSVEHGILKLTVKEFFPNGIVSKELLSTLLKFRDERIERVDLDWWFDDPSEWMDVQ